MEQSKNLITRQNYNQKKGKRVIIGCGHGNLYEFSVEYGKIIRNFGKISKKGIRNIAISPDNKGFFVSDHGDGLYQFDLRTKKCIKDIQFGSEGEILVTFNGE